MKRYRVLMNSNERLEIEVVDCPECKGGGYVLGEPELCSLYDPAMLTRGGNRIYECDLCCGSGYIDYEADMEECEDACNY